MREDRISRTQLMALLWAGTLAPAAELLPEAVLPVAGRSAWLVPAAAGAVLWLVGGLLGRWSGGRGGARLLREGLGPVLGRLTEVVRPDDTSGELLARLAGAGADLVIGGHPHWVQGWDLVGDTTVVHSLGNFVFDMQFSRQVQEGVFVELELVDGDVRAIDPVPYVIRDHIPQPASPDDAARILRDVRSASTGPYADGD